MEFGQEKSAMFIMRSGKWHVTQGIELPNQEKIRTLREKETYKYIGILEVDIIKQVEMKKIRKSKKGSQENEEITRKPNYIAEISSKG